MITPGTAWCLTESAPARKDCGPAGHECGTLDSYEKRVMWLRDPEAVELTGELCVMGVLHVGAETEHRDALSAIDYGTSYARR